MAMIENVTPILRVEDLEASRRYYIKTLGFSLDWDAGTMISVSRDHKSIMLCEGDKASRESGSTSVSKTPMCFSPNSWLKAHTSEVCRRISAGPTSFSSKILTATFFALGLSRSLDRRMESSSPDLPRSSVPHAAVSVPYPVSRAERWRGLLLHGDRPLSNATFDSNVLFNCKMVSALQLAEGWNRTDVTIFSACMGANALEGNP